jgi:hypothetical protein
MSALILAAVRDLLSWELDHHSGCNEAGAALHEAIKRVESYGRDDLLSRLLCAVIATSRDDRQREDAAAVLALLDKARRADADALSANEPLRRPLPPEGDTRRREAAGE